MLVSTTFLFRGVTSASHFLQNSDIRRPGSVSLMRQNLCLILQKPSVCVAAFRVHRNGRLLGTVGEIAAKIAAHSSKDEFRAIPQSNE